MQADIGGSYGTGDLSDMAPNWMVVQAKSSGITMKSWQQVGDPEWGVVTSPVVHGKGSYGTGDLSNVALNWIVEQAKTCGLTMKSWEDDTVGHPEWGIVTNPVIHGKGTDALNSDFRLRTNNEVWAADYTLRKNSNPGGLTTQQIASLGFISYSIGLGTDADGSTPIDGTVNMEEYAKWLKENYGLDI
jgi:hypothetical protein